MTENIREIHFMSRLEMQKEIDKLKIRNKKEMELREAAEAALAKLKDNHDA